MCDGVAVAQITNGRRVLRANPDSLFVFGEDAGMGRGIPIMLSTTDRMTYNNEGTEVLLAWKLG